LLAFLEENNLSAVWDHQDNRHNVAGGPHAVGAQVIAALICPTDSLPESVTELTAAYSASPPWSRGHYGMSSYGGVAGRRSVNPGGPPDFPGISRDGIFFLGSRVRLADVTDGSSQTLLFGERYHEDAEFDLRRPAVLPGVAPMAELGRWSYVANPGVMANATLHSAVDVNFQAPPLANRQAMDDRVCAFGSGHPGGANFTFADGSARFLTETVPLTHLQTLSGYQDE
jgi:prepilin-type processing-associated H-X9-DG protein